MSQLHITQACFLQPVLEPLKGSGSYDRLLQHSGLDKFNLDVAENYLPSYAAYNLMHEISRQEGVSDLASCFSDQIELVSLAQWGQVAAFKSNLLSAMQFAASYDQVVMSQERIGFQINGDTSIFWSKFIDHPVPGREQFEFINLMIILKGFRLAAGSDWSPLEIHLQSNIEPALDHFLPLDANTRVRLGQSATAIVFPSSLLFLPLLERDESTSTGMLVENVASTLTGKIENLLNAYQTGLVPNMILLTDMLEMSTRSLQRKLFAENTSLSEIIDQWRFQKSIQYLDNSGLRVRDISELLGYANVSNFERAFRRWTQTTPNRYRDAV